MKTAISLPDPLFQRAEALADSLGKSRSELYRDALTEYLERHDPEEVTEALEAALDELGEPETDPFVREAGARILRNTEW